MALPFDIDASLAFVQEQVELWMFDEVRIERHTTTQTWDPVTGVTNPTTSTEIYEGKARISPSSGGEVAVGEDVVTWRDSDVYIPLDAPLPHSDDLITVLDSRDPALVGRVFRVRTVVVATISVSRKMSCTSLEPSSESFDAP